jgi:hypothetical protein
MSKGISFIERAKRSLSLGSCKGVLDSSMGLVCVFGSLMHKVKVVARPRGCLAALNWGTLPPRDLAARPDRPRIKRRRDPAEVLCKSDHSATSFFFFFLSTTAACFRCCCCCCCWPFSLLSFSLSSFSFSLRRRGFDSTTCPQIHNSSIHTTRSIILPRLATTSAPTKIK